jgi:hypothetical protein
MVNLKDLRPQARSPMSNWDQESKAIVPIMWGDAKGAINNFVSRHGPLASEPPGGHGRSCRMLDDLTLKVLFSAGIFVLVSIFINTSFSLRPE